MDTKNVLKTEEFNVVVNTNFWDDKVPKEGKSIDSVMKMEKNYYLQVYLEEWKYKTKAIKMPGFIDVELGSDSSSDSVWL